MFSQEQIARALSHIEEFSKLDHCQDEDEFGDPYNPGDNGNFDGAFNDGLESGRIDFARELMIILTSEIDPVTLTTSNISLLRLKERVQSLIDQQGEDAPVCAFIFTNEDVFVMDKDGNPDPVQREIAETVLCNLDEYDHIYTEIFNVIEKELAEIQ